MSDLWNATHSIVVDAHRGGKVVNHKRTSKKRKKSSEQSSRQRPSATLVAMKLSIHAPVRPDPAHADYDAVDLEFYWEEEELWFESIRIWIARILNEDSDNSNVDRLQGVCVDLWNLVEHKPQWYSWPNHVLAALSEMRDGRGFRYQFRHNDWTPIDAEAPFVTLIQPDSFVQDYFPEDVAVKFTVFGTAETRDSSTNKLHVEAPYFRFNKGVYEKCVHHLRKSLIASYKAPK